MAAYRSVVVVGASLAGLRAVEALRQSGHDGAITVIGAEARPPYDRPPLSKQLLTGRVEPADVALPLPPGLDAEWILGRPATGIDLERRTVALGGGSRVGGDTVGFDGLVLATGAHARTLPFLPPIDGIHLLRTLDDAIGLRAALLAKPRVVVIGAGFIGLEVAASSRTLGLDVTVLEAAPVPLAAAVGPYIGGVVAEVHREHSVDLRLGVGVEAVLGAGRVEGVRLAGGEVIPADIVVVGVGAAPTTGWLEGAGIDLDAGVRTDDRLRVLAAGRPQPHVVAAGDLARFDVAGEGPVRVEHWTNAVEQAAAAVATLLRGEEAAAFSPVPYFWSDHYDRKIQMVGRAAAGDDVSVVDGSAVDGPAAERRFVAAYGRGGRLVAAVGLNRPAKVMALGRRIAAGDPYPVEA